MTLRSAAELASCPDLMKPPRMLAVGCVVGRTSLWTLGPKGGKSTTAAGVVRDASQAGVRCGVLCLDEALADTLQRLNRFEARLERIYLDDQFHPETLEVDVVELGIELLVVDHLGKIAEGHPEFGAGSQGDPVLWGRLMAPFTMLARTHDVAVVLLDQARRSDGKWAGSVAKGGGVDLIVELSEKDGGLEATPRGRVALPPFRVELDAEGRPQFSGAAIAIETPASATDERGQALLRLLSDSEPEGLTSSAWEKVSGLPKTTYHRSRKALLRAGLALSPADTRSRRYRITEQGEAALEVPEVPTSATGTTGTAGRNGATGAKPYVIGLARGTSPAPGDAERYQQLEREAIEAESVA